jgi:hypothetical protein
MHMTIMKAPVAASVAVAGLAPTTEVISATARARVQRLDAGGAGAWGKD